jgi:hypothetical protein
VYQKPVCFLNQRLDGFDMRHRGVNVQIPCIGCGILGFFCTIIIISILCIHMLDMVRWMLDLGWPKSISSSGGIFVDKKSKANITDTQWATFAFDELPVVWQHRSWGEADDLEYPWGAILYGDKGTLKVSVFKYEFTPLGAKKPALTGRAVSR